MDSTSNSNVKIISTELIKPSSPTPNHLRSLKLSLLDQLAPPVYISLIFFYEANELKGLIDGNTDHAQICQHLKQSLSNTLTLFYPLAGKIDPDNFTIDCNDNGVEFIDACAQARLEDILRSQTGPISAVSPTRDLSESNISPSLLMGNDKLVTKKYVFDKEKLSVLKQEAIGRFPSTGSDYVKDPTRVEVVSAFIWKHFIENKISNTKKSLAGHIVNIRSRASPSLDLENAFGNGCFLAVAIRPQCDDEVPQLHEMVNKLRRAIRMIDEQYIREAHEQDRYLSDLGELSDLLATEGEGEGAVFSSWCRFPIYEVDFGWGRPVWACTTALLLNNVAILMSTRFGDGIEAWINLLPQNVEAFEHQFKLITATN
ncbi:hypothetical protein DH2020_025876 [Rehmannia glutinosa]|uniref:Uncharacterized protein n=1 Tax=Rehmannia glutinosa TaxID=99300 RepID=A0ABR0W1A6_REHGL